MVSFSKLDASEFHYRFKRSKKFMKRYHSRLNLTSADARKLTKADLLNRMAELFNLDQENKVMRKRVKNGKVIPVVAPSVREAEEQTKEEALNYARRVLENCGSVKLGGTLVCLMKKLGLGLFDDVAGNEWLTTEMPFFSTFRLVRDAEHIETLVDDMFDAFDRAIDEFVLNGSDWSLEHTVELRIDIWRQKACRVGTYLPLPKHIVDKKAVVNIQNMDDECFKWCMKYHQSPQGKNDDRISVLEKVLDTFDYTDMKFPVTELDVSKFSVRNKLNIFVMHEKKGEILRKQYHKVGLEYDTVYLWFMPSPETTEGSGHYAYIKNVSRLMNNLKANGRSKFCRECCKMYNVDQKHSETDCATIQQEGSVIRLTNKDGTPLQNVKFKNFHKQAQVPFIAFADFECTLREHDQTPFNIKKSAHTKLRQKHVPNSYAYNVITTLYDDPKMLQRNHISQALADNRKENLNSLNNFYFGDNPAKHLLEKLLKEQQRIETLLRQDLGRIETPQALHDFNSATTCYLCGKKFSGWKTGQSKVWDHCHHSGAYRGACHSKCNLDIRNNYILPVVFHNLRGYDGHLIIKEAKQKGFNVRVIANTSEKYMNIRIGKLNFIDSLQFMDASLDELTKNLYEADPRRFRFSKQYITELHTECHSELPLDEFTTMMLRKGVYPYSHIKSNAVFKETEFPPPEAFTDFLTQKPIELTEYAHAKRVWTETKCKTLKNYHTIYLFMDVNLLTDVFLNFRQTLFSKYGLDCCHYLTLPSFSWDAMLKHTKVELELLGDYEMLVFCEKANRGGLCFVNHRYGKSNHPQCKNYDPSKATSQIIYLDMNNLYGGAMRMYLPFANFQWVKGNLDEMLKRILKLSDESPQGYYIKVDLHFPDTVHDKLKDYPPCPENIEINFEMLSEYNKKCYRTEHGTTKKIYTSRKLTPHLNDHKAYVLDYRLLKKAVELGVEVMAVHKILQFDQSPWLRPYIDKNTEYRRESTNDFDKDVFKLLNNSVYGKTCENLRNRRDVKVTSDPDKALKYCSRNTFKNGKEEDGMYYIELCKAQIVYDRPSYVGVAVLDLSKKVMLDFHYDFMTKQYGDKQKLLTTDTDSLAYHVETENIYADISSDANKHRFDLSNMGEPYKCMDNCKTVLKMKSEAGDRLIDEWISLRPKCYAFSGDAIDLKTKSDTVRKCKGIQSHVVKNVMTNDEYRTVLQSGKPMNHITRGFVSKTHTIYSYETIKKSLSAFYDKMHVCEDGISCLPYGHYALRTTTNQKKQKKRISQRSV